MLVTRSLANVKATAALGPAVIEQNGFFYGDEQYYVVSPPVIHVYYQPPADSDSASGMPRSPDGVKKPDSYFHETFVLAKGKWVRKYRTLSKRPDGYLTANSCDTTNALSLPGGPLGESLPHAIKIKALETFQNRTVVVYSDTPDRNEYYALKTALLEYNSPSWHVTGTVFSGDAMHFCGTKSFHARLSNGEEPLIFLLYLGDANSDEPDFISIQSFMVRERLTP